MEQQAGRELLLRDGLDISMVSNFTVHHLSVLGFIPLSPFNYNYYFACYNILLCFTIKTVPISAHEVYFPPSIHCGGERRLGWGSEAAPPALSPLLPRPSRVPPAILAPAPAGPDVPPGATRCRQHPSGRAAGLRAAGCGTRSGPLRPCRPLQDGRPTRKFGEFGNPPCPAGTGCRRDGERRGRWFQRLSLVQIHTCEFC